MKNNRRRVFQDGRSYHITHRCHNRDFKLGFACDRSNYCMRMWEGKQRYAVDLLDYVITSNHVHLLISAREGRQISGFMRYVSSLTARDYNRRKERSGGLWAGRYHATLVQDEAHLGRCLFYIGLNMVRARAVDHPSEWAWSGYDELVGDKHRYRLLTPALLWRKLGGGLDQKSFTQWYEATMRQKLENLAALRREDHWTSAKVVGDPGFVARAAGRKYRQQIVATGDGACYF